MVLYGLATCDSCRQARKWLAEQGVDVAFHDLRRDGLTTARLDAWLGRLDWQELLNRRSTTWRELSPAERGSLDTERARALMLQHPTLIKRPILEHSTGLTVGFTPAQYEAVLAGAD